MSKRATKTDDSRQKSVIWNTFACYDSKHVRTRFVVMQMLFYGKTELDGSRRTAWTAIGEKHFCIHQQIGENILEVFSVCHVIIDNSDQKYMSWYFYIYIALTFF